MNELKIKPRRQPRGTVTELAESLVDKVRISIEVTADTRQKLKTKAASEGYTIKQLISGWIKDYLTEG